MANLIDQKPLILDTAAATVLITETFNITKILLASGSSGVAGDSLILKDKNGKVIFETSVSASKETVSQDFFPPLVADGLACTTLTNGLAYIYYEGPVPLKTT